MRIIIMTPTLRHTPPPIHSSYPTTESRHVPGLPRIYLPGRIYYTALIPSLTNSIASTPPRLKTDLTSLRDNGAPRDTLISPISLLITATSLLFIIAEPPTSP